MKIQANSRQVPKVKTYTADKKYCDLLYGTLQEISEVEEVGGMKIRYIEKKDVSYSKLGDQIGLSRQTVSTKFKNLISMGLIEEDKSRGRYLLKTLDNDIAALIPYETLRKLTHTLSHNCISTYVYILNRYFAAGQKPYFITLRQIKEFIGLAVSTSSNDIIVTDILDVLNALGLISCELCFIEDTKSMYQVFRVENEIKKVC